MYFTGSSLVTLDKHSLLQSMVLLYLLFRQTKSQNDQLFPLGKCALNLQYYGNK